MSVSFRDRKSGEVIKEKIYGEGALRFLYENKQIGTPLLHLVSRLPLWSILYGWYKSLRITRRQIQPFIEEFDVDPTEFAKEVSGFDSFSDFFVRTLKPECRPIPQDPKIAIIPADGRYLVIPDLSKDDGLMVKGKAFSLQSLLKDRALYEKYRDGILVFGRLCPTDYHRFHFPCNGPCSATKRINGYLYSVNPIALKENISILTENKRCYSIQTTDLFGDVLLMEIGATSIGSIIQTFNPTNALQHKGDEKGYFDFGGSSIILLFEKGRIDLCQDLAATARDKIELRCLIGEPLGLATSCF